MTTTSIPPQSATDDPFAFAGELLGWLNSAHVVLGLDAGHRAGVIDALASAGSVTSSELARLSSLSERHVREWLDLMVTGGVVTYDPSTRRYALPSGAAACLTSGSPMTMAPATGMVALAARHVPAVARTLREGGGIPYEDYPDFHALMDAMGRSRYDAMLVDGYVAAVPGLAARLEHGARVADIGCGSGHVVNLLAKAFPASHFTGYDRAADAIDAAREEARSYGLGNARFEQVDVAELPDGAQFDVITAFDAVHDQARPRAVLSAVRRALAPDGLFLMVDANASSHVDQNIGRPMAPLLYGASLFHCMQVSLAEDGEGLGTAWGVELAKELLTEAGFREVVLVDAPPADLMNVLFVCR